MGKTFKNRINLLVDMIFKFKTRKNFKLLEGLLEPRVSI